MTIKLDTFTYMGRYSRVVHIVGNVKCKRGSKKERKHAGRVMGLNYEGKSFARIMSASGKSTLGEDTYLAVRYIPSET